MVKKGKDKKKCKGAEKTAMKTEKKLLSKQKKQLAVLGEDDIETIIAQIEKKEAKRQEVTEVVVPPPTPRANFSIVAHPEKEELIIFGGEFFNGQKTFVYNDMFIYNITNSEWKLVKAPSGPPPRCGHQMITVSNDGGQLWIFGGEYASPTQSQFYHYRDLWVFRIAQKKWEKINRSGAPSARSGHRMVANKKKIFVFGGFHDNLRDYKYFNDVYIFSMEDYIWTKIEPGGIVPAPRSGCCFMAGAQDRLIVWGGYSKTTIKKGVDKGFTHTDMFALSIDKHNEKAYKWVSLKAGGVRPGPRSGMSICATNTGALRAYIFGGVTDVEETEDKLQGSFNDDFLSLDLENIFWNHIQINSIREDAPMQNETEKVVKPDENACSSKSDEPKLSTITDGIFTTVIGGSTSQSSNPVVGNELLSKDKRNETWPRARMNAGLVICKGQLYLYGGLIEIGSKQFTLSDLYSLDIRKMDKWKVLIPCDISNSLWVGSDSESSDDDKMSEDEDSGTSDSDSDEM